MDFLAKGVAHIKKAAAHDEAQELREAFDEYKLGLEYLVTAIKYERNDKRKQVLNQKVGTYLTRAEEIKRAMDEAPEPRAAASHGDGEPDGNSRRELLKASALTFAENVTPVHWDDIAGLATAKQLLREAVVLPFRMPHLFGKEKSQRRPWNAILLYGPPGTGKTRLAQAVATESRATFFSVSASDLMSKWVGESEKAVRDLFALAAEHAPSVIFIDEIDSLCGQRGDSGGTETESTRRVKNEFLTQTNALDRVLLLAATNLPWSLDVAFRRRFKKRVYVPLPDCFARAALLRICLGGKTHTVSEDDVSQLAYIVDGYSGSDIATIVDEAYMQPIREMQTATHFVRDASDTHWTPCSPDALGAIPMVWEEIDAPEEISPAPMTHQHLGMAFATTPPTVSTKDLGPYDEWTREFGQSGD